MRSLFSLSACRTDLCFIKFRAGQHKGNLFYRDMKVLSEILEINSDIE